MFYYIILLVRSLESTNVVVVNKVRVSRHLLRRVESRRSNRNRTESHLRSEAQSSPVDITGVNPWLLFVRCQWLCSTFSFQGSVDRFRTVRRVVESSLDVWRYDGCKVPVLVQCPGSGFSYPTPLYVVGVTSILFLIQLFLLNTSLL